MDKDDIRVANSRLRRKLHVYVCVSVLTGDVVAFDVAHMCPSRHFPFNASACLTAATNEEQCIRKRGRQQEARLEPSVHFRWSGSILGPGTHSELKLILGRTMNVRTEPASNTSLHCR